MKSLAQRIASRYYKIVFANRQVVAAFISDKWFKAKKAELKEILNTPLRDNPEYWGWKIEEKLVPFFDTFQKDFENQVSLDQALESIRNRVAMAKDYAKTLIAKLDKMGDLRREVDFKDPASYLRWRAVVECHQKMAETTKTLGNLFKVEWTISEDVINRLVQKTLKEATEEEQAALTDDGDRASQIKYTYLARIGFDASALKALKKSKLDWDLTKWIDRIYEMLAANYSEKAIKEQDGFREFDLHGIRVIVDDKTVFPADIKKYVKYLMEAHSALKAKGFAKAWYGNVFIQCKDCGGINPNTGGGVGGHFKIGPDTVTIFSRPSNYIIELMIHELGHRYWFKHMSGSQRAKFTDLVKVHTVPRPENPVTVKTYKDLDLEFFKSRIESCDKNARYNLERAKKLDLERATSLEKDSVQKAFWETGVELNDVVSELDVDKIVASDPEVSRRRDEAFKARQELVSRAEELSLQRPSTFDEWAFDMDQLIASAIASAWIYIDLASLKHNEASQTKLNANPKTKEWLESYERNPAPVLPVSSYGKSNIDEAFAEVFTHYVLGFPPLSRDQLESFRSVLSSVPYSKILHAAYPQSGLCLAQNPRSVAENPSIKSLAAALETNLKSLFNKAYFKITAERGIYVEAGRMSEMDFAKLQIQTHYNAGSNPLAKILILPESNDWKSITVKSAWMKGSDEERTLLDANVKPIRRTSNLTPEKAIKLVTLWFHQNASKLVNSQSTTLT